MATLLQVGDVFEIKDGMTVMTEVPNHLLYSNCVGDWTTHQGEATPKAGTVFEYLADTYVVTQVAKDGGSEREFYPDGHHVWAQSVNHERVKINFYQTGSFRNMHPDIPVIGKAKAQTWTWDKI